MKKIFLLSLLVMALFTACEKETSRQRTYSGGETKVKIGTWSTETVGNGKIVIDLDRSSFELTAGSENTRTELDIAFDTLFRDESPATYSFEKVQPYLATGDYWKETSNDITLYSHEWGTGLLGSITINNMTEDIIEGEYEFIGKETLTDYKQRTVKGSFSLPRE